MVQVKLLFFIGCKLTFAYGAALSKEGSQLPFAAPNVNVRSGWKASPHIICVLKPCLHKKYANTLIQQSK